MGRSTSDCAPFFCPMRLWIPATLAENLSHHQQAIDLYTKKSIVANYGVPT